MITFKELRYVALLDKYKNFSQAAKHAGISQPALSMAISKLEEKLDVTLLYRMLTISYWEPPKPWHNRKPFD